MQGRVLSISAWMPALAVFFLCSLFGIESFAADKPKLVIGVTKDQSNIETFVPEALIKAEISDLLESDYQVHFKNAWEQPLWKEGDLASNSELLLKDNEVDLILALGILSGQHLGSVPNLSKPVVAPFVIDPSLQGFKVVKGASGIKNFTYIADKASSGKIIDDFRAIVPFKRMAVVLTPSILEGVPRITSILARQADIQFIAVKETPEATLELVKAGAYDAVMLAPLLGFSRDQLREVANGLTDMSVSSFTMQGREEVALGFLAGYGSEVDNLPTARRVALNIQRILDGEPPATIPVYLNSSSRVVINEQVARKLNRYPGWDLVDKFEVVNKDKSNTKHLSLDEAIRLAQERSLSIILNKIETKSSYAQLNQSRSNLLPQLALQANHKRFDQDLASAGNPQTQNSIGVNLSQVIWSGEAFHGYKAQKYVHLSQEEISKQVSLDAILDVLAGYLNLLQAQRIEELQLANVERAKRNLELAEVRKRVGSASAGEVYRWQSEIANSQSTFVSAKAQARQLTVNLLQLLNLPQNQKLQLSSLTVEGTGFFFNDERFERYLPNPWSFEKFHEFMVAEALENSPDLAQLRAQIKSQEELFKASKQKRWTPTLTANAGYNNVFETDGVGQNDAFEAEGWQAGLNLQVPLFTGGNNAANQQVAEENLHAIRVSERQLLNQLEAQVRNQLLASQASFPSMEYAQEAADSANKNLDLVTDAYQRGALSILDLIDAQNSALSADIQAVNSVYVFMLDYFKLQRVVGYFDVLSSERDKEAWYERLRIFIGMDA